VSPKQASSLEQAVNRTAMINALDAGTMSA
jgi:hypothetical protein